MRQALLLQNAIAVALLLTACAGWPGSRPRGLPEKSYQADWCAGRGQAEVVLPDGTRCDCVTPTHAVEFDFGPKWAEAIGQSLNYALQTNKRAGIVLIIRDPSERKYLLRLNSIIAHHNLPIDVWQAGP
jgi:hypothetical protein